MEVDSREYRESESLHILLLGVFRDGAGRRLLSIRDGVDRLSEDPSNDFQLRGPRSLRAYATSLRSANQHLTHHDFFERKSGLSEKPAVAKEHHRLHEALRLAIEHDQLDTSNSAALEYVSRRIVQIEAAARSLRRRSS